MKTISYNNIIAFVTKLKAKLSLKTHNHNANTDISSGTFSTSVGGTGKGTGSRWISIGSCGGSGSVTMSLGSYQEVAVGSVTTIDGLQRLLIGIIPKARLSTSSLEMWLSGGKSDTNNAVSGNARGVVNITSTRVTPASVSFQATEYKNSSTFYVYAR